MSESASIFLTGETLPGFVKEDVITALTRLLNTDKSMATSLLSGRETLIKRNATPADIERYTQALRKAGAAVRAVQPSAPSAFPTLFEDVDEPASAPAAPAPVAKPVAPPAPKQDSQQILKQETKPEPKPAPRQETQHKPPVSQELTLAPGWSKPGEEQAATAPARMEQASGTGIYRPPVSSVSSRSRATEAARADNAFDAVYAEVPVFGFSTEGRIGRLRYMAYLMPAMALMVAMAIVAAIFIPAMGPAKLGFGILICVIVVAVVLLWMSVRIAALRLHDLNRSGKWVLLPVFVSVAAGASGSPALVMMAPVVLWILSLALMFWPGSQEYNDYGPPSAPNNEWIQIGAILYLALWAFSIVGTLKYEKSHLSDDSDEASQNAAEEAQADARIRSYAKQLDAQTPFMMGPMLKLDKVEYADKVLRYTSTIQGRGFMITDEEKDAMKKSMLNSYCGQGQEGRFFPSNKIPVDFVFRYQVTAWDYDSFTLKLSPESCR
ncbi:uncharacterized membrane protein YhaH (DUF805 family) [Paucimonas lemoignei]|uniref:Uncharacterized membrane protein YhaH (DUF805 family) n=1 Tax=Paucimonas lemoignei TaxID=29443 RepID=A0A4R3I2P1_PAULE|nr:DUF805 domain-containing protein [Paucimonas lemoignei]TCS39283.1 uncharacterized membrane protein YhaH (DUF805 family) [Paucimonas lemoignei]